MLISFELIVRRSGEARFSAWATVERADLGKSPNGAARRLEAALIADFGQVALLKSMAVKWPDILPEIVPANAIGSWLRGLWAGVHRRDTESGVEAHGVVANRYNRYDLNGLD